jgi:hypothetical protein
MGTPRPAAGWRQAHQRDHRSRPVVAAKVAQHHGRDPASRSPALPSASRRPAISPSRRLSDFSSPLATAGSSFAGSNFSPGTTPIAFSLSRITDSHFKRTRLGAEEPVGRVTRRFAVATGCSACLSWHFRAGAGAKVAACGQAGGGQERARPASRRGERRRFFLPVEALVELEGRGGL